MFFEFIVINQDCQEKFLTYFMEKLSYDFKCPQEEVQPHYCCSQPEKDKGIRSGLMLKLWSYSCGHLICMIHAMKYIIILIVSNPPMTMPMIMRILRRNLIDLGDLPRTSPDWPLTRTW